jgi:hypothetical protein
LPPPTSNDYVDIRIDSVKTNNSIASFALAKLGRYVTILKDEDRQPVGIVLAVVRGKSAILAGSGDNMGSKILAALATDYHRQNQ